MLSVFLRKAMRMATPCPPWKIWKAYLEFAEPEYHILHHAQSVSVSGTELISVQFWLILAQIWLTWQRHVLTLKVE